MHSIPLQLIASLKSARLKLTPPRLTILHELLLADRQHNHQITPEVIYQNIKKRKRPIALGTIYRSLKIFETHKLVLRHDFHDQKSYYELNLKSHHDHLIDSTSGKVVEFYDKSLEELQDKIAKRLGYEIVDHQLTIYARPLVKNPTSKKK